MFGFKEDLKEDCTNIGAKIYFLLLASYENRDAVCCIHALKPLAVTIFNAYNYTNQNTCKVKKNYFIHFFVCIEE